MNIRDADIARAESRVATGPMRAVQRGDLRLRLHITRAGWRRLLCGRPYGNKYYREHGDPRELEPHQRVCKLCAKEFERLRAVYTKRDGRDSIE